MLGGRPAHVGAAADRARASPRAARRASAARRRAARRGGRPRRRRARPTPSRRCAAGRRRLRSPGRRTARARRRAPGARRAAPSSAPARRGSPPAASAAAVTAVSYVQPRPSSARGRGRSEGGNEVEGRNRCHMATPRGIAHAAMGDDPLMAAPDAQLLVVEDDEVVATFLVELLGRLGSVHWTTTAEQALTVTASRDWDLVISDIDLPGMNGLEFLGGLRAGAAAGGGARALRPQQLRPRGRGAPRRRRRLPDQAGRPGRAAREGARADRGDARAPREGAGGRARGRRAPRRRRDRRRRRPAAPRGPGSSRHDPDTDRRRAGRRRARTARRSRAAPRTCCPPGWSTPTSRTRA